MEKPFIKDSIFYACNRVKNPLTQIKPFTFQKANSLLLFNFLLFNYALDHLIKGLRVGRNKKKGH